MVHSAFHFFFLASALLLVHAHDQSEEEIQMRPGFGYYGDNGPDKWGSLSPKYATCQSGKSQSPIDIKDHKAKRNKNLKALDWDYKICNASFINSKFFVELSLGDGGWLKYGGKQYTFKKITYHIPSEHTIDGTQYDVEAHLVHTASDGSKAIIAVLFEIGNADPIMAKLQNQLSELGEKEQSGANKVSQIAVGNFNARKLEGATRKYYHYVGSLTSPPCTENVNYIVHGKVRSMSKDQAELLKAPLDDDYNNGNNRPVQPLNGRTVELYGEKN